jgi:S1-C subfamily serine protease
MAVRLVPLLGGGPIALPRLPAAVGSGEDADVLLLGAAARHAVLFERDGEVVLVDSGSPAGTFVAGRRVEEAVLRAGDVIRLGQHGPELRFERELDRAPAPAAAAPLSQTMMLRILGQTRSSFRRALLAIGLGALALLAWSQWETRRVRQEMAGLRREISQAEAARLDLQRRADEERRRGDGAREALERRLDEARAREEDLRARIADGEAGEMQALKDELGATRLRIASLEDERAVGERIIKAYGGGVALLQGAYEFTDEEGRLLRYASEEETEARPPSVDGRGPPFVVDYYGTGFLVDAAGLLLTNRHVAQPWWNDPAADALAAKGFKPRFVRFRAFFPGQRDALAVATERVSEKADLALLRLAPGGRKIPVLPLERQRSRAVAGQPVVVVGYPTGLEAILAKAESGVVQAILESHGTDSALVTDALSRRGLIRPSTTQGHIGDITPSDIVFDAPSAQGGSGGPVFNKHGQVIAVEYAVLPKFGGTSFGVPITYALDLLRAPRASAAR